MRKSYAAAQKYYKSIIFVQLYLDHSTSSNMHGWADAQKQTHAPAYMLSHLPIYMCSLTPAYMQIEA